MPSPRRHWLDDLTEDLFAWIQTETAVLVHAFRAGGRSPFAAQITESDKLVFYTRALFNPDGSDNVQGRAETLARLGPEEYARTVAMVRSAHGMNAGTAQLPPGVRQRGTPLPELRREVT
jgi:hypothetical protein